MIAANGHLAAGYKADGKLVERPAVEFSNDFWRYGIRYVSGGALEAHDCNFLQSIAADGKYQVADTQMALTASAGGKSCIVTYGLAVMYQPDVGERETRKYAATCLLSKYFTCRYSSGGLATYDVLKTSKCVRVCRAASWTSCEPNGSHGECPASTDCADNCEKDGRSASFWCSVKVAGL